MVSPDESAGRHSPISAAFSALRRLIFADPVARTLLPSVLLGIALSVTPTALLLFNNHEAVARSGPFYSAMAITAGIAGALVLVLSRRCAPHVAGGLVGALGYGFYSLSWVPSSNQLPSLMFLWLATALPAAVFIIWLLSNSRTVISTAGLATTAVASFLIISPLTADSGAPTSTEAAPETLALVDDFVRTPNVYLFVLDGFAHPRVTTEQFATHGVDFDIDSSIATLEELGLQHEPAATSNYGQTILSMPSMLNGAYPNTTEDPLTIDEVWQHGRSAIRGDNQLVNSLRAAGYEYWSASSGAWDPSRCDARVADVCLGDQIGDAEATKAVWRHSPLRWQLATTDFRKLSEPQSVVDDILKTRETRNTDGPYLAISHIIGPHQPYRYEADCSLRNDGEPGTTLNHGGMPEFRPLYANQARCIAEILETAVADIVAVDPDALIFVQADHGSEFEFFGAPIDSVNWTDEMRSERLGIFRATKMPDSCRSDDVRAQSVVNTVPIILACLSDTEPELIEPRYFFTDRSGNRDDIVETDLVLFG